MKKAHPLVSFVIVNYNGKRFLKNCLDSLMAMEYPKNKREVIMVDNCSSDGSPAYVRENYPNVKIFKNDVNNYARANNLGIRHAKGEFVALVNNDLVFDKVWLRELVKVISADKKVGAVMGKVLFPDGKLQGTGHYVLPNFYWSDRGFREEDIGQYDRVEEMRSISHCAVLYRSTCLQDVGSLDEDFNMYVEDVDMAIRASRKGWRLLYAPRGRVYHKFHGTVNEGMVDYYCERNRLFLIAKHYPEKLPAALLGKGYFTVMNNRNDLVKILPEVINKLIANHNVKSLKTIWPAFFDNLNMITNGEKDHLIKQLDHFKQDVSEKDRLLSERNQQIAGLGPQLAQKDSAIAERDRQLSRAHARMKDLEESLSEQKQEAARKDEQLTSRDQQLSEANARMKELEEALSGDQQLAGLVQHLAQKDAQLHEKDRQLTEKDRQLAGQGQRLAQRDGQLSEKAQQFTMLEQQLSAANARLRDLEEALSEQKQEAGRKDEQLTSRDRHLSEVAVRLMELEVALSEQKQEAARKDEQLTQKDAQLLEKDRSLSVKDEQLGQKDRELVEKDRILLVKDDQLGQKDRELVEKDRMLLVKDDQLGQKDRELVEKDRMLLVKDDQLGQKDRELAEKDRILLVKDDQLGQKVRELEERERELLQKNQEINQGIERVTVLEGAVENVTAQLDTKSRFISDQGKEILALRHQRDQFYRSETYRFIIKPMWALLDFLKLKPFRKKRSASDKKSSEIILIKSYCVTVEEVQQVLAAIASLRPNKSVALVVNAPADEIERLRELEGTSVALAYCSHGKRLSLAENIRLISKLRRYKPEEVFVIISHPVYHGYRQAKMLALLSGAKQVTWYYVNSGNAEVFKPRISIQGAAHGAAGLVSLWGIAALFYIFVVLPSKVLKLFRR